MSNTEQEAKHEQARIGKKERAIAHQIKFGHEAGEGKKRHVSKNKEGERKSGGRHKF